MIATDLKTGSIYKENNQPYKVEKYAHSKVARGGATVRIKARNLITGPLVEKSFNGNAKIEGADTFRNTAQYLYKDSNYIFMDPRTYEQFSISPDILGDSAKFLLDGTDVQVLYFEGNPVSIDLPLNLIYEVEYTEPGFKGNTVTNTLKDATMTNGLVAKVPTFIKIGDKVKIDTRSGEYVSKA